MLRIQVGSTEFYDEEQSQFVMKGGVELELEHSLFSLSKWESTFEKPFLGKNEKSPEEIYTYVKCMMVNEVPEEALHDLSETNFTQIQQYIDAKMTATWFSDAPGAPKTRDVITAELIYYWMTVFSIPFECEHWHLNRLFALIRVCNLKQAKPKKMSRAEQADQQRRLNAERKAKLGTSG